MPSKQIRKVEIFCIVQVVCLIVPLLAVPHFAVSSGFAASLPVQYAANVLALFMAALAVTVVNYGYSMFFEDTSTATKIALFVPTLFISVIAYVLWTGGFPEKSVDQFTLLSLTFALTAMFVSLYEWRRSGWRRSWAMVLWCVNFPLAIGLLVTFLFKYLNYYDSSHAYISFMARHFKVPQGSPPEWPVEYKKLQSALQANFWTGFSAGIIAIQMITAQIVSTALRVYEALHPMEGKS